MELVTPPQKGLPRDFKVSRLIKRIDKEDTNQKNYNAYDLSFDSIDRLNGYRVDFSLKTVLSCVKAYEVGDYGKMFELIGYPVQPTNEVLENLVRLLTGSRFSASFMGDLDIKYKNGDITKEEYEIFKDMDKSFDFNADFDLVFGAFIHYFGMDLIDTDINYFKFKMLFEYVCLDTSNPIINRMKIRTFTPVKGDTENVVRYNENMSKLKDKYTL